MKFWFAAGSSIAALLLHTGAIADPVPTRVAVAAGDKVIAAPPAVGVTPLADTVIRVASVTQAIAQVASTAIVAPANAETAAAAAPGYRDDDKAIAAPAGPPRHAKDKLAAKAAAGHADKAVRRAQRTAAERKATAFRCIGRPETGTAAWYGGRYVGRRTSNGSRLDTVHPTAAHRTLPLNSLARVTNLRNGRSIVVRVTDRGPIDDALLIDMSPRAADELQMKEAGLVPVRVEQVVELPADTK
jgi:rare lipoprotein A (peptidoglycan hydrolase)